MRNPFRRSHVHFDDEVTSFVAKHLLFSAYYDPNLDMIVVGVRALGSAGGPEVALPLWDAVNLQDMIGAAVQDAVTSNDGTVQ